MAAVDHFSIGLEVSAPAQSLAAATSTPNIPTISRRICLRNSSLHAEYSPSHRAVSFSSWTRYSTLPMASSSGQLKASVLCKASGTSSSYDPPVSEWVYLGADQPAHVYGRPEVREKWSDWRQRRSPGGSLLATPGIHVNTEAELVFGKQPIKRLSTESQLTSGIKMGSCVGNVITSAERHGLQGLTCGDLPSAFDSDSDEEE